MSRWASLLAAHARVTLIAFALVSVAAAALCVDPHSGALRLSVDPSIERLLRENNAARAVFDRVRSQFGDPDVVLVAVRLDPVFTADHLRLIGTLTQRLAALPGVRDVASIATAPNLAAEDDALDLSPFTGAARRDPAAIERLLLQLAANPLYRGTLVSADGRVAALAVSLASVDERAFRERDYVGRMRSIAREVVGDAPVWITGSAVIKAATSDAILATLRFTIPAVLVLVVVILSAAFRSLRATLVATAAILLAALWTLACAAAAGVPVNLVTALVPPLVATVGLSYALYALSEHLSPEYGEGFDRREKLARVLRALFAPLTLSGCTTIAGLLALAMNPLPAIRQFAVLAAAGTAFAGLLSLVFIPVALSAIGSSRRGGLPGEALAKRASAWLADFDTRQRKRIIAVALLLLPTGAWLASGIRAGTQYIEGFSADSQVRRDYEAINRAFDGANFLTILVETYVDDALTDPGRAREIERLEDWLNAQPEVGGALSYVDYLKLINRSLSGNGPASFAIPGDAAAIKQLLVFAGTDDLKHFVDGRFRSALVSVRINVDGSTAIRDLVRRIETRLAQLPPPLSAQVTGSPVLATRAVDDIGSGQITTLSLATAAIFLILSALFTSWQAGFAALLPNLVPIAVYFGTLGALHIPLDPTTSLIACIVLGIAVDDTIQYLARFNAHARASGSERAAAASALAAVLRPVTLATLALCLGFTVYAGGGLASQIKFGLLSAFTLLIAWAANITVTPALGTLVRIVTLWDLLRLDLGQSPQYTIPLLAGLSTRQARVFALLSKLETVPAGQRIITEGDLARDVFVVVDGTLEVWVERNGERKRLTTLGRGATLGETGYFGQQRTANVDATTQARLLRFDSQDLERLRGRHPRIAATVYRNLNRIQAERMARVTAMVQ